MGLEDRDYLRDEARRYGGGGGFRMRSATSDQWAIRTLIIINVAVYVLQLATSDPNVPGSGITSWLSLSVNDLSHFQLWRVITYGFCHSTGSLMHILFNMLILWMFGRMVEGIYGSREFLCFYLTGILISGLAQILVHLGTGTPAIHILGASGGVNAVVILTAMHFPKMKIYLMMILPMQLWVAAILFVAIDAMGAFDPDSGVAHVAHLGGAAFGFFYYRRGWRISPLLSRFERLTNPVSSMQRSLRNHQRKKDLQVFEPNDDDLRAEVDKILEKIQAQGESSLTDEERQTLERASRIFRGR